MQAIIDNMNKHFEVCKKIEKLIANDLDIALPRITCEWTGITFQVSFDGITEEVAQQIRQGNDMVKKEKELTCRYGHQCTSGCQKDFDCPCQADHCCALTQDCDGTCDDCFNKNEFEEVSRLVQPTINTPE